MRILKTGKRLFVQLTIVSAVIMLPCMVKAQTPGDPGDDPDAPAPIDGGISLLIAAGVGLGAKKLYEVKRNREVGK